MRRKIDLYIDGKRADLTDQSLVLWNYAVTELQRPTIVKNSYSKQITLAGTPANDAIFSGIYRTDMVVDSGTFNPLERTPFTIYNDNGEVLQTGYLKLERIDRVGATRSYVVSLYGGIGSALYSLMYDKNGEKRSLASLTFGVSDNDFLYTLDKSILNTAWTALASNPSYSSFWGITNFAPCYNGTPKEIQANKARLSSNYAQEATLSRKYTEWETRDLRCWLQRPVIRVRSVLAAIFSELQNMGKDVELDSSFFRNANPYFDKTWMLLPMFSAYKDENAGQIGESSAVVQGVNVASIQAEVPDGHNLAVVGDTFSSEGAYNTIDLSGFDASYFLKGNISGRLDFDAATEGPDPHGYLNWYSSGAGRNYGTLIGVQYSVLYGSSVTKGSLQIIGNCNTSNAADKARLDAILANFGTTTYRMIGNDLFSVDLGVGAAFENVPVAAANNVRIAVEIFAVSDYTNLGESTFRLFDSATSGTNYSTGTISLMNVGGTVGLYAPASVGSGTTVTKKMLLADTASPAEFLLSFCKQFNLRIAETAPDTISILSLADFYNGEQITLDERVDRKELKITPLLFEKKWQKLGLAIPETYMAKEYKQNYGKDFGTINLDTGYQLNTETEDFLEGSIFKGGVSGLMLSSLFYDFVDPSNRWLNPCLIGGYTINGTYTRPIVSGSTPLNSNYPGYDFSRKMFGYSVDGDEHKSVEIAGSLVFLSGVVQNPGKWYASQKYGGDGVAECWLLNVNDTNDTYTEKLLYLPSFSRYYEETAGLVSRSLDFGTPSELYAPGLTITTASSIYTRAWQSFLTDQCDKSGKRLTAKVRFDGMDVGVGLLRHFFWYEGSLWVLNKITNYSLTTWDLAECEFIQVQNITNYTSGQTW